MEVKGEEKLYSLFASLLSYPKEDIKDVATECIETLSSDSDYSSEPVKEVKIFLDGASKMPLDDLEGIYSYSFELSADHTLDLAFHLFDGFKRSNVLVSIKEMYKANGFPYDRIAKGELPDNLTVILKFLSGLEDQELKKDLRENMLIKALEKLSKSFDTQKDNIYSNIVKALLLVVDTDVKKAA
jgi:nitrate reductase assembly molybdenum cofactor insertion protein NarJ